MLQASLLTAVESGNGQQPAELRHADSGSCSSGAGLAALAALLGDADTGSAAALLAEGASLAPEQLQIFSSVLQQQDEHRAAMQQDDADEGATFSDTEEGAELDAEEEGEAFEGDAQSGAAAGSCSAKQHYKQHMSEPLWKCEAETAQLMLYQAIFMLMAWKTDYVVRDAAFIALLGILCRFLLPKVCAALCRLLWMWGGGAGQAEGQVWIHTSTEHVAVHRRLTHCLPCICIPTG
jgi:hypothetical protein